MAGTKVKPPVTPSVVALALVLDRDTKEFDDKDKNHGSNTLIGQAEGYARKGEWDKVRSPLDRLQDGEDRFRTLIALAAVGSEGKEYLEEAIKTPGPGHVSLYLRLIDVGANAGVAEDRLQALANSIPAPPSDASPRGRGQLLAFKTKLERSKAAVDEKAADAVGTGTLSALLAKMALARHNTRLDGGFAKTVQTWSDPDKAFGSAGAILGCAAAENSRADLLFRGYRENDKSESV